MLYQEILNIWFGLKLLLESMPKLYAFGISFISYFSAAMIVLGCLFAFLKIWEWTAHRSGPKLRDLPELPELNGKRWWD